MHNILLITFHCTSHGSILTLIYLSIIMNETLVLYIFLFVFHLGDDGYRYYLIFTYNFHLKLSIQFSKLLQIKLFIIQIN